MSEQNQNKNNFEGREEIKSVEQQKYPELKYQKAREVILKARDYYDEKYSNGEIDPNTYAEKMGKINDSLVKLDKNIEKFLGKDSELIKTAEESVEQEIETRVEDVVEDVTTEQRVSGNIENLDGQDFEKIKQRPEFQKTKEVLGNNLIEMAKKNPLETVNMIEKVTGMQLDAGEIINVENNPGNEEVIEAVSEELLKNYELRIQSPNGGDSFMFVVLDPANFDDTQKDEYKFLRDFALTPDYEEDILNYSNRSYKDKVIAFEKKPVEIEPDTQPVEFQSQPPLGPSSAIRQQPVNIDPNISSTSAQVESSSAKVDSSTSEISNQATRGIAYGNIVDDLTAKPEAQRGAAYDEARSRFVEGESLSQTPQEDERLSANPFNPITGRVNQYYRDNVSTVGQDFEKQNPYTNSQDIGEVESEPVTQSDISEQVIESSNSEQFDNTSLQNNNTVSFDAANEVSATNEEVAQADDSINSTTREDVEQIEPEQEVSVANNIKSFQRPAGVEAVAEEVVNENVEQVDGPRNNIVDFNRPQQPEQNQDEVVRNNVVGFNRPEKPAEDETDNQQTTRNNVVSFDRSKAKKSESTSANQSSDELVGV